MSVSAPSDIQQPAEGFGEQVNSPIPGGQGAEFPMDGAGVATEDAYQPGELTSEPGPYEFNEDDINFLQSDEVREYLSENVPSGFMTETTHNERIAKLQQTKDSEVQNVRQQLNEMQGASAERAAQTTVIVNALRQAWQEAGYEPGSQEYQQREAAVMQAVQIATNEHKVQQQQQQQERGRFIAAHAAGINQMLQIAGISPMGNQQLTGMIYTHLNDVQNGRYQTGQEVEQAKMQLIQQAKEQFGQQASQQQVQPAPQPQLPQQSPQAQVQPAAQPRQNFGPGPGPRGGGGGAPVTYEQAYEEERARAIQQYGAWNAVPQSELNNLDFRAQMRAIGVDPNLAP